MDGMRAQTFQRYHGASGGNPSADQSGSVPCNVHRSPFFMTCTEHLLQFIDGLGKKHVRRITPGVRRIEEVGTEGLFIGE
jgi:hypothetical protein